MFEGIHEQRRILAEMDRISASYKEGRQQGHLDLAVAVSVWVTNAIGDGVMLPEVGAELLELLNG